MTALRQRLRPIPQSPVWHPEGDVWVHTHMVRYSMRDAMDVALGDCDDHPCLSLLNFDLTREEEKLLSVAAWMHDIGKIETTTLNIRGHRIPYIGLLKWIERFGRWQAIGHERPKHFKNQMRKLAGTLWERVWRSMRMSDKTDLFFVIKHHMRLANVNESNAAMKLGFGRRYTRKWINAEGQYKNKRRIKLLILLILMDRFGQDLPDPHIRSKKTLTSLQQGADRFKRRLGEAQSAPAPNDPVAFVESLAGKPEQIVRMAFRGKFGRDASPEEIGVLS